MKNGLDELWFDPNSILTQEEVSRGLTYDNSERVFKSKEAEEAARQGFVTPELIVAWGPRYLKKNGIVGRP